MTLTESHCAVGPIAIQLQSSSHRKEQSAWLHGMGIGVLRNFTATGLIVPITSSPTGPDGTDRGGWKVFRQVKSICSFPAWCHACFHVGRTLQTDHEEFLALVQRFAQQTEWNVDSIHEKLNSLDAVYLSRDEVKNAVPRIVHFKTPKF